MFANSPRRRGRIVTDCSNRPCNVSAVPEFIQRVIRSKRIACTGSEIDSEEIIEEAVVVGVASVGPIGVGQQVASFDSTVTESVVFSLVDDEARVRTGCKRCVGCELRLVG